MKPARMCFSTSTIDAFYSPAVTTRSVEEREAWNEATEKQFQESGELAKKVIEVTSEVKTLSDDFRQVCNVRFRFYKVQLLAIKEQSKGLSVSSTINTPEGSPLVSLITNSVKNPGTTIAGFTTMVMLIRSHSRVSQSTTVQFSSKLTALISIPEHDIFVHPVTNSSAMQSVFANLSCIS